MSAFYLSVVLGAVAVMQAGLNRQVSQHIGLSGAVLINTLVLLLIAFGFLWITSRFPENFPEHFPSKGISLKAWWFLIPGICGFLLVAGLPFAVSKIGALTAFLCLVTGQMVTSLLWDYFVESIEFNIWRVGGALLAVVGLTVSTIKG
ncbi:MAG: DMT family transporter [Bdellovibrionales bacterium]|nr:DMT family transporter [Bdellovibrionales bacterium]